MIKKRVFIGLAALAALAVSGCGGSGNSKLPVLESGTLNFIGAPTGSATSTTSVTVPATGGTTVTLSDGSTAVVPSGSVPGGTTIPAGTKFAIIPKGIGFPGADLANSQMSVNGVAVSGALVGSDGLLDENVALPVSSAPGGTHYTVAFLDATLNTSRDLNIANVVFSGTFYVKLTGGTFEIISPVPTSVNGTLPNNGENASGTTVLNTYGDGNSGRTGALHVDYGTGFFINQSRTIANGTHVLNGSTYSGLLSLYADLVLDAQNVPPAGVKTVEFDVSDL